MLTDGVVFLLDVDNTLLDNDRFAADLDARLLECFGDAERRRYWTLFEALRAQHGVADYLGALQAFRDGLEEHPRLLEMSAFLLDYPFHERLFAHALAVIGHLRRAGTPVVLSDGDVVFQPRKIERSGIRASVEGRLLICRHKERELAYVRQRHPARHYVAVDDKPDLLAAMKRQMGADLTTLFVRQGHYAHAPRTQPVEPPPDLTIQRIGDLLNHDPATLQVTV